MILDNTRRRTSPRRVLLLAAVTGAAALFPLSMLRPAAQAAPLASAAPQQKAKRQAQARVSAVHAVPGELDAFQLTQQGRALTPQAAAVLEHQIAVQPNNYPTRIRLLGYYEGKQFASARAKAAYEQQVFWLIQNHPASVLFSSLELGVTKREDAAAFEQGKTLWLGQVAQQPKSTAILGNAARYCLSSSAAVDNATTEQLLRQAESLEPKSPVWPDKLGQLYRLEGEGPHPSAGLVRQSAKKALPEYETASMLATHTSQPVGSADLAKTAFDAGEYDKARRYAEELLKQGQKIAAEGKADPRTPQFIFQVNDEDIHEANLVLGRLALRDGDQAGAEAHLLAMGRVSGSSSLNSFGPNMQLAEDLLKRGDRQPVLAYFDECGKFWKDKQLTVWRTQVEQGKLPDFRGNLVY